MQSLKILFICLASFSLMLGCENGQGPEGINNSSSSEKVTLLKATAQDISANVVDCQGAAKGKKEKKICVAICHKPPGNPDNSKSKVLPLKAVLAHLEHGGPNHGEHDTLGLCDGDGEDDMEDVDPEDPTYGNDDEEDDSGMDGEDSSGEEGSDSCSDDGGMGSGDGSGSDDGMGSGDGSGSDDGMGSGDGSGSDDGMGSGDGAGSDDGMGAGDDVGIGSGDPVYDDPVVDDSNNLPQYCLDNMDVDPDCDGINNYTDEFMY